MIRPVAAILLALAGLAVLAGPATAANSLHKNALALSVEAESSPFVGLKWNIDEANALAGAIEFLDVEDGQSVFGLQVAYAHYWRPADFTPYSGAAFQLENVSVDVPGADDNTNWFIRGFVGVEAFIMSNASVAGDLGLDFGDINERTVIGTSSSAVRFNLYFN